MPTPTTQLLSRTSYAGDGVTTLWNFTFAGGYIDRTHVKAYTQTPAGVRTELTVVPADFIGAYQLRVLPAVAVGLTLTIYRNTPKDIPLVDFVDGGNLTEAALDTMTKQAVFGAAEVSDELNLSGIEGLAQYTADAQTAAASAAADAAIASAGASGITANLANINIVAGNASSIATVATNIGSVIAAEGYAATINADRIAAEAAADEAAESVTDAAFMIAQGLGFTASTQYDFGYVSDPAVVHPTDYGTIP